MSNDDVLDQFRTHLLSAGRAAGTIRLRLVYLRQFAALHPDLLTVSHTDLEVFLAERRQTHKSETRSSIRSALVLFYRWAHEEGLIPLDPGRRLIAIRKTSTVPRVALDQAVQKGLAGASSEERAIILLARFGALRRAEIAGLHTANRDGAMLRVLGKGEKERRVPLNAFLLAALEQLEREQGAGFYFRGPERGHATGERIYRVIHSRVGINPHALRHAAATAAYRATHDLRAVQELLGHASIGTTERYLHVGEDALRAVADATAVGFEGAA